MPILSSNRYLSPRVRMYLVIGVTLASVFVLYSVLSGNSSAGAFLKSHPLPFLVLWIFTAMLAGWLRARDPRLRAGLFFKSFGTGLMIFAASAIVLFDLPSSVSLSAFLLG